MVLGAWPLDYSAQPKAHGPVLHAHKYPAWKLNCPAQQRAHVRSQIPKISTEKMVLCAHKYPPWQLEYLAQQRVRGLLTNIHRSAITNTHLGSWTIWYNKEHVDRSQISTDRDSQISTLAAELSGTTKST
jgi:hypothetical protein